MDTNRFIELLDAYLLDAAGEDDQQELFLMIASGKYDDDIRGQIMQRLESDSATITLAPQRAEVILKNILEISRTKEAIRFAGTEEDAPDVKVIPLRRKLIRFGAAAAILFLVFSLWFLLRSPRNDGTPPIAAGPTIRDLKPGDDRAMLTLADGTVVYLDSTEGNITKQGDVTVLNLDGKLSYDKTHSPLTIDHSPVYNTITTPRGGQYQIVLADGSKVWLNAASSLKFPVSFTGNERKVELTGEGFFEIVHNSKKPFLVSVNGAEVHDLGTAFNISAYGDEQDLIVTLVQGSAEVKSKNSKVKIKPGDQAQINQSTDQPINIKQVDVAPFLAWKENKFYFDGADIHTVARQLSRWYNVDVEVKGNIPDHFTGIISRKVPSSQVFDMLEKTGAVKFRIDGNKIIISK